MSDEAPATEQPNSTPTKPVQHGASDATLWLFLGGITFLLLVLILFILAAS